MSITLTVASTTVTLTDDLLWTDELKWHPVLQTVERSLTGALLVDTHQMTGGRPITLAGADARAAWLPRSALLVLQGWAATAGQVMTLVLRGSSYQVMWRHQDAPALDATPVIDYSSVVPEDWYRATLKLMVIS